VVTACKARSLLIFRAFSALLDFGNPHLHMMVHCLTKSAPYSHEYPCLLSPCLQT
jgi:hypothetical protein